MKSSVITSFFATLHCLAGCLIGELLGLLIGVGFGLSVGQTLFLAIFLAYVSGMSLALFPIMRRTELSFLAALRIVWVGEAVSIAVMEVAMNGVDYWVGGLQAQSLTAFVFWYGLALGAAAGFVAAWPVNHWLLKRELKKCH